MKDKFAHPKQANNDHKQEESEKKTTTIMSALPRPSSLSLIPKMQGTKAALLAHCKP